MKPIALSLGADQKFVDLASEVEALRRAGTWNRAAFERLLAEAQSVAPADIDVVEGLLAEAMPEWRVSHESKS